MARESGRLSCRCASRSSSADHGGESEAGACAVRPGAAQPGMSAISGGERRQPTETMIEVWRRGAIAPLV